MAGSVHWTAAEQRSGFSLVELLVAMAVLTILTLVVVQLFDGTRNATTASNKRMDADGQARLFFDRLAVDFARMVKRADVDYLLKQPTNKLPGNDRIAFYSEVPGYYSGTTEPSPVSLVAYRVGSNDQSANYQKVERLGKGLAWNGTALGDPTVLFLPIPLASPLPSPLPSPIPSPAPTPAWPQADNGGEDPQYELIGPHIFRFEYYYLLKGQSSGTTNYPSVLSDTPWDTRIARHLSVNGLQDVAAIVVVIAVIDPTSRKIVSDAQLNALAGQFKDYDATLQPGEMEAQWQAAINTAAPPFPAAAAKWLRVYHRYFYLNTAQ